MDVTSLVGCFDDVSNLFTISLLVVFSKCLAKIYTVCVFFCTNGKICSFFYFYFEIIT